MTIDDAIEMLGFIEKDNGYTEGEPGYNAIKLGIEALKRIKKRREQRLNHYMAPLSGETKE